MVDLVGKPPFLRIALPVAMATMHFHIAETGLFFRIFFFPLGFTGNNLAPIRISPGGAR